MADFSGGFGYIGGAVNDLFSMGGHNRAAGGLDRAAALADQSGDLSVYAGKIKVRQVQREAYKIIGGQEADVAGAGFTSGGSAMDLLRSSTQEAALAAGVTKMNAAIDTNDFRAQAQSYRDQAAQQRQAAQGDMWGTILKVGLAVASFVI